MESQKKKKISALFTALIVFVSIVSLSIVYAPRIFGCQVYSIDTGSMTPTIPQGSLIYVKPYTNFEDYSVNDIVTFSDLTRETFFTHRIVEIDSATHSFVTKGDANNDVDPSPTESIYAVGKVQFSVPVLGYVASFLRYKLVKIAIAVIYIAWIAIEAELFLAERKKRDE